MEKYVSQLMAQYKYGQMVPYIGWGGKQVLLLVVFILMLMVLVVVMIMFVFEYVHYPQHSDVGLGGKRLRNRSWSMSFHWRCPERGGVYKGGSVSLIIAKSVV